MPARWINRHSRRFTVSAAAATVHCAAGALTRTSVKASDKLQAASRHRSGAAAETMGGGARGVGVLLWVLLATELVLQPQCGMAMAGARRGPGAAAHAARQLLQIPPLGCLTGLTSLQIQDYLSVLTVLLVRDVGIQYVTCVAPLGSDTAACCTKAKADFVNAFPRGCYNNLCQICKNPSLKPTFDGADGRLLACFALAACP